MMSPKILFLLLTVSFTFFLSECKNKEEEFDFGYDYYPMEIGTFRIYDVFQKEYVSTDSIKDTFQIKEVVADTFYIGGELRYRLERFKRNDENESWPLLPDSIWTVQMNTQRVIKIENNVRFIKLIFPVEKNKTWDGNNENYFGSDTYKYTSVGGPYEISGTNYTNTVFVLQEFDTNQVSVDIRHEVYGKGIGLIEKYKEVYEYLQINDKITDTIEGGIVYREILNSYGN